MRRWENQANKATLVFNETPHPSIRNKCPQGTPALFCTGLALWGENEARLQGRCLWVWGGGVGTRGGMEEKEETEKGSYLWVES